MYYFPVPQMSAVDDRSETLREIIDAKINKNKYGSSRKEREIADSIISTEADRLMARNVALQEEEEEEKEEDKLNEQR